MAPTRRFFLRLAPLTFRSSLHEDRPPPMPLQLLGQDTMGLQQTLVTSRRRHRLRSRRGCSPCAVSNVLCAKLPSHSVQHGGLQDGHPNGVPHASRSRPKAPSLSRSISPESRRSSNATYETQATSFELPALQAQSALDDADPMEPLTGDPAGSFDLVAAPEESHRQAFSLERRSEQLFSQAHLEIIFSDPSTLLRFTAFLSTHRPQSVPILIYYLDALKALKAIRYANAIAEALSPIKGFDFTANLAQPTANHELEEKAAAAFAALTQEDLPAFVTQMYVQIVSLSISRRITGTLAPHLREASEGLAEVFCLTDPSRPDNPIVFASEGTDHKRQKLDGVSADFSSRVPPNNAVWYELCHWPELSIFARSKDSST